MYVLICNRIVYTYNMYVHTINFGQVTNEVKVCTYSWYCTSTSTCIFQTVEGFATHLPKMKKFQAFSFFLYDFMYRKFEDDWGGRMGVHM